MRKLWSTIDYKFHTLLIRLELWLRQSVCSHYWHCEARPIPVSHNQVELFRRRPNLTTWWCEKCGKRIIKSREWIPLNYIHR